MVKVVFSPAARQDLTQIGDYIALRLHNKTAARNTMGNIQKTILGLRDFPESGTPLLLPGVHILYRYLVCGSYMVFYHVGENTAYVDRILYGRRDYLNLLFGEEFEEIE